MKMKSLVIAAGLVLGSTVASQAQFIDNWNASLNTPQAKREFLARTCAAGDNASFYLCERMKRTGVPNSDVRLGLAAAGLVVGAGAGMVAAGVPFAALGGKTAVEYVGITSVLGWAPTVPVMGIAGAVVGTAVVGGAAAVSP